jgi:alpha-ribazole phosphatase
MKIYVIRHGLTKHNKLRLINGQAIDEGLEPEGFEQAAEAVDKIPKSVNRIYASSMKRTRDTADTINKVLNVPISYHPEVIEVGFGKLSGRSWDDIAQEFGDTRYRESYLNTNYDYTEFGGESVEMVKERVQKLVNEIKNNQHKDGEVLVVSHGGILRVFYNLYVNKNIRFEFIENASLHEFEV